MAKTDELPPKGAPGVEGRKLRAFVNKALTSLNVEKAKQYLDDGTARFNRHE